MEHNSIHLVLPEFAWMITYQPGCHGFPWTGGAPSQSASEPPVFCFGSLECLSSASAAAMLQSH
jgi:hypothetical protein